ncbi:hypothetical protein WHY21_11235 [Clostridium perfringens]|uniref:hypothetical protein n=1 Tax=Clostridium perfringens TaxID=1502 RepID=UPI001D12FAEB|nr:hypothetical protein [Clostridium perfringens]MCC2764598.1 hypothetical protein [Clostridium perfringens]MCG4541249.1 hypothetical protein [Clostridium perfringens]MCG4544423.1 hypothetical protein [Clostridium perfringens]MCG4552288.1 hypothetical protein [Clostridium perfringens]MCG4555772.1 hypothetical protein [Clostridium perfringens]
MELLEGQMSIFDLKQESEKNFDFIILVYKSVGSYKSYKPKEKIRLVKGMKIYYIGYEHSGFGYYDCIIKEVREDSLVIYDYLTGENKELSFKDCDLGAMEIEPFAPLTKGTNCSNYLKSLEILKIRDIDLNDYNDEVEARDYFNNIKKYARNRKYIVG